MPETASQRLSASGLRITRQRLAIRLVCRTCDTVVDVDHATGEARCLDAAGTDGFVIDEAEVTWWGHCAACQATARQATARQSAAR